MKATLLIFVFLAFSQSVFSATACSEFPELSGQFKVTDYSDEVSRDVGSVEITSLALEEKYNSSIEISSSSVDPLDENSYAYVDLLGSAKLQDSSRGCQMVFIQDIGNITADLNLEKEEVQITFAPEVVYGLR